MTYNIKDLARRVSDKVEMKQSDVLHVVKTTFDELSVILVEEHKEVRIKNFTTFKFGKVAGKTTKHPKTGEEVIIPDRITIRLGLSTKVKRGLNHAV